MDKELRRRRWIVRRRLDGWTNQTIASHLRISERTVIRWWNVYLKHGWNSLAIKSRRPHAIHRTSQDVVEKILKIRMERNYGPNKIEAELKRKGTHIGHNTIHRILVKRGLNNPLDKLRRTWGKKRFERGHSNSLWQADFKLNDDDRWMITLLDDHSRFVTGCKVNLDATNENAIKSLEEGINKYGCPKQLLTDQGTQFVNQRGGITLFQQFCIDSGIDHIVASKRRPTTIGKVERFHRTYEEENHGFNGIKQFIHYYNYIRINQALGYLTPAEVYFRDRVTDVVG